MVIGLLKVTLNVFLILVFLVIQQNNTFAHEGGTPIDEYGCHHYIINGEYHNYHENNPERPCEPDVIPDELIIVAGVVAVAVLVVLLLRYTSPGQYQVVEKQDNMYIKPTYDLNNQSAGLKFGLKF